MSKFARIMLLGLGFGILAVAAGTITNYPVAAAPGTTNVVVTNTPLPTSVTNFPATQNISGTVGINNFPSSQNVNGTVGVNNFPSSQSVSGTVNVGNFPASQNVSVTNPQTQPVPVVDATIQPFGTLVNPILADGQILGSASFTVPLGQRLIIEFVAGNVCLPVGQKAFFQVLVVTGTSEPDYLLPGIAEGTYNGFGGGSCDNFIVSQPVRIYAEPGSTVTLYVARSDSTGSATAGLAVAGHLVNTQ